MSKQATFVGVKGRKMKPTMWHVPAIWECMLGTVYARNAAGVTKYFDYDYAAAREWVGMDEESDPRVARESRGFHGENGPRKGRLALYVNRNPVTKRFIDAMKTPRERRSRLQKAAIALGQAAVRKLYTPDELREQGSRGLSFGEIALAALRGKRID